MAFRSAPDEDGWISITAEPVEEKDINSLVAAAMEKPAVSEQALSLIHILFTVLPVIFYALPPLAALFFSHFLSPLSSNCPVRTDISIRCV